MLKLFTAASIAAMAIALPAQAAEVYNASGVAGNQSWTGTLGLDFSVTSAVLVSKLGVFDAGSNGLTNELFVGIFNSSGTLLTSASIGGGTGNGGASNYLFVGIADYVLLPGTYQLASWGYDDIDQNYNNSGPGGPITFDSVGGRLTALGSRYSASGTGGVFATLPDVGSTRYGAGSFSAVAYTDPGVPEPATWGMMLVGFGMAGAAMRRRKAVAIA